MSSSLHLFVPSEMEKAMLGGVSIFNAVEKQELDNIAALCSWGKFEAQQEILSANSPSENVFFLLSGRVRAHRFSLHGREITFDDLNAGDIFGEIAAIDKKPRSADVTGVSPGLCAFTSDHNFRDILQHYPRTSYALNVYLAKMIRKTSERVMVLASMEAYARVFHTIISSSQPHENSEKLVLGDLTHYDIACMSGCTRETVSRSISTLLKLGIAEKKGRNLFIKDKSAIEQLILKYSS
jgi:CRP-like cAMP-binding protein